MGNTVRLELEIDEKGDIVSATINGQQANECSEPANFTAAWSKGIDPAKGEGVQGGPYNAGYCIHWYCHWWCF